MQSRPKGSKNFYSAKQVADVKFGANQGQKWDNFKLSSMTGVREMMVQCMRRREIEELRKLN